MLPGNPAAESDAGAVPAGNAEGDAEDSSRYRTARQRAPMTVESLESATRRAEPSPDFTSEEKRNGAVAAYTATWNDCSDAALARTAKVHPSDLIKWKKGSLPSGSEKKARIEKALRNNEAPTLLAKRSVDG